MVFVSESIFGVISKTSGFTNRNIRRIEVDKVTRLHVFTGYFEIAFPNFNIVIPKERPHATQVIFVHRKAIYFIVVGNVKEPFRIYTIKAVKTVLVNPNGQRGTFHIKSGRGDFFVVLLPHFKIPSFVTGDAIIISKNVYYGFRVSPQLAIDIKQLRIHIINYGRFRLYVKEQGSPTNKWFIVAPVRVRHTFFKPIKKLLFAASPLQDRL